MKHARFKKRLWNRELPTISPHGGRVRNYYKKGQFVVTGIIAKNKGRPDFGGHAEVHPPDFTRQRAFHPQLPWRQASGNARSPTGRTQPVSARLPRRP